VAVPAKLRSELYKFFPNCKTAEMKTGGNFPFLSRHEEFNLYLQVKKKKKENERQKEGSHWPSFLKRMSRSTGPSEEPQRSLDLVS
jgi:hypothetical protein